MDRNTIEKGVKLILLGIGEDPEREGLRETPNRVARMYEEVLEGTAYTNKEIAEMFGKTFEERSRAPVTMKDITVFSYCEHHIALMYNMKVTVSYIPDGKVIGLSKIARIADMCAKRLQLQEKLTADIAECIMIATGSEDVAVKIVGNHSCMTARGIKNTNSVTETMVLKGRYKVETNLMELLK